MESTEWLYWALQGTLCQCVDPLWGGRVLALDWLWGVLLCKGVVGVGHRVWVVLCVWGGVGRSAIVVFGVGSSPCLGFVIGKGVDEGVCVVVFCLGVGV